MEKIINFWLKASKDDLKTAEIMLKANRYNYAMFMCQQSTESLLKAIIAYKTNSRPPYLHDLVRLSQFLTLKIPENILENLKLITPHYIKARYFKERYDSKVYNKINAKNLIAITKETRKWLIKEVDLKNS